MRNKETNSGISDAWRRAASEADTCVAVYGSLKRGFANHHYLGNCTFLGRYRTHAEYTMVDLGEYPGLVEGGRTAVDVEIYQVDAQVQAQLDELEDVPREYRRTRAWIPDFGEVLLYVLSEEFIEREALWNLPVVESGCWTCATDGTQQDAHQSQ